MQTVLGTLLRERAEKLLSVDPLKKPGVYAYLYDAAEIASLNYWLEVFLSAGIATFGLVLNSPAVVIGAMLISPLMGPILSAGLALAAVDLYLAIRSALNLALSVAVSILWSAFLVWLLPFHVATTEILNRTQPNLLDLGVAFFSGLAGSILVVRGAGGGGVTGLPGVAIAVALMPPLCTVGFGVGSGFDWPIVNGALLLFLTNLAAIVASAFAVFFLVGMDAPAVRAEIYASIRERRMNDWLYGVLQHAGMARSLRDIGKLRWRVLMVAAVIAVLFVPLTQSLRQLRIEATGRAAVHDAIRQIAPRQSVVAEHVDISQETVRATLVVTEAPAPDKVKEAERSITLRTGRPAQLSVRKVAGEEELALLRERLKPAPPPPPPPTIESVRAEWMGKLDGALRDLWPAEAAVLEHAELALSADSPVVRLRYQSPKPMDEAAAATLRRALSARLGPGAWKLDLIHSAPEKSRRPARQ